MKLLYAEGSNCAQRVRWAINYKQVPYDVIMYDDLSQEQLKQLSPLGKVPAVMVDRISFAESIAILEYLEEKYPKPELLPKSPISRAKVREAVEVINGWVHPVQCSSAVKFFYPEGDIKSYRKA
jgi:glutathione S-transferase